MVGYMLFNNLSATILWVAAGCFFIVACVYSYNNITDKKEDKINRGKINAFSKSKSGTYVVFLCALFGLLFSFYVSSSSFILSAIFVVAGFLYSRFRIKSYFLVKNLYTAFFTSFLLLIGAAHLEFSQEFFLYYLLFFISLLLGSIIADLRDFEGDNKVGLRTLPVILGYRKTKYLVYSGLILSFLLVFRIDFSVLFPILPFILLSLFFVKKNSHKSAHAFESMSLVFLAIWLISRSLY